MDLRTEPDTIPDALRAAAARFGDREAVVATDSTERLTFHDLLERTQLVARAFLADGVAPGDRVAIYAPNTYHWVVAALGASYIGATIVPISTRFTGTEARDILERGNASVLVIVGRFLGHDRLAALRENGMPGSVRTVLRVPGETASATDDDVLEWHQLAERAASVSANAVEVRADAVDPDDPSDILFTSGTTGRSKGAVSAHRQALGVAAAWAECGEVDQHDRYLAINPFFHSFGYKAGILVCLLRGAAILPLPVFDVDTVLPLLERERVTVLPGPPTLYGELLDHPRRGEFDLDALRLAVTGAANVPVALVERMQRELSFSSVLTAYGLTEAVVATMCRPEDDPHTIANTCGRAAADFEVRIDERSGEILLRGSCVMLGYLDDPEATAQAIDPDGWLHTGDVGTLDERGYLTITDRLKDMYICGGFNVYPAEVEQTLARLDGIAESAVIGVPDTRLGEVGEAHIVLRPGHQLHVDEVIAFCREQLANYKRPRHVTFREHLPRNPSGKVLKTVLRAESLP